MAKFTVIIEKAGGNYSAYCPELPGCVATGKTEAETLERMKEALSFHLEGLKEIHAAIPETTCTVRQINI